MNMKILARQGGTRYVIALALCVVAVIILSRSVNNQNITIEHNINLPARDLQRDVEKVEIDSNIEKSGVVQHANEDTKLKPSHKGVDMALYERALASHSSSDKWITLALADQGCIDMTVSLIQMSFRPFQIDNYLIIGSDTQTCAKLARHEINCYVYVEDKDAGHASVYYTKDFLRKMNIRTFMILDALRLGYNVLHTDLDIFFMKNPFANFDYQSSSYDVAPLFDWASFNAGFLFIRATGPSVKVYQASAHIANTEPRTDDQIALNRAIASVKKNEKIGVMKLPMEEYQCGKKYWTVGRRNFIEDQACATCVVVHNNWIVSMEAKGYRFKEIGMWGTDTGGYYSNVNARYMTYDNEVILRDAKKEDLKALENALAIGQILNRTVILPKFHCNGKRCTLLDYLLLRKFDKSFPNYREHSFLKNPLVPEEVRHSVSNIQIITSEQYVDINQLDTRPEESEVHVYQPIDRVKGATSEEIMQWFGDKEDSVLRFDNLLGAFCCFSDSKKQNEFKDKIKSGFKPGRYKQDK